MTIAVAASIAAAARGTMHESWRPSSVSAVFSLVLTLIVSCVLKIDGVGFTATLKIIGAPFVIPPTIPPLLFFLTRTFLFSS